jgi:hypothetical protein
VELDPVCEATLWDGKRELRCRLLFPHHGIHWDTSVPAEPGATWGDDAAGAVTHAHNWDLHEAREWLGPDLFDFAVGEKTRHTMEQMADQLSRLGVLLNRLGEPAPPVPIDGKALAYMAALAATMSGVFRGRYGKFDQICSEFYTKAVSALEAGVEGDTQFSPKTGGE